MKFKQYIEGDSQFPQQEASVQNAMMKLYYAKGLSPAVISQMKVSDVMTALQESKLLDPTIPAIRFATMVKLAARMFHTDDKIAPTTPEDNYET